MKAPRSSGSGDASLLFDVAAVRGSGPRTQENAASHRRTQHRDQPSIPSVCRVVKRSMPAETKISRGRIPKECRQHYAHRATSMDSALADPSRHGSDTAVLPSEVGDADEPYGPSPRRPVAPSPTQPRAGRSRRQAGPPNVQTRAAHHSRPPERPSRNRLIEFLQPAPYCCK